MAVKNEGASALSAAAAAVATAPAAPAPRRPALAAWLPVIAAIVLAPALSWAVAEFVLLPRMEKRLAAVKAGDVAGENASVPVAARDEGGTHGGKPAVSPVSYEFQNIVVNLAGTMGTRYLKTTFIVTGTDVNIKSIFDGQKARLTDITLNVLSSLSLADLEEPGAKNVLREKLVLAYNQALGKRVAEQVYFSDFVVQ